MEDIKNTQLHPCKYCGNTCKGKQCKQCHLKMISRQFECIDCRNYFVALRCNDCNEKQKLKTNKCPDCGINYSSVSKDGKIFEKCYECYQKGFSKCKICDKKCFKQYFYCKTCYENIKEQKNDYLSDYTNISDISNISEKVDDLNFDTDNSDNSEKNEEYIYKCNKNNIENILNNILNNKKNKCKTLTCNNDTNDFYCMDCIKNYKLRTININIK